MKKIKHQGIRRSANQLQKFIIDEKTGNTIKIKSPGGYEKPWKNLDPQYESLIKERNKSLIN